MTAPPLNALTPVAPTMQDPTVPPRAPSAARPRVVSEFYGRYLSDQLNSIQLRGGTEADMQQFMDAELRRPMSAAPVTPEALGVDVPQWYRGVSMAVLQGATFGFGDEAMGALLGTLTGVGARAGIDEYRAEYEAWTRDNYKTALAAEIAGSILTAKAPLGIGKALAGAGPATWYGTVGRGALAGGLAGAGAGQGDFSAAGLGERTKAALFGAASGAVVGGALSGAAAIARPVATAAAERTAGALENAATRLQPTAPRLAALLRAPLQAHTPEGQAREILKRQLDAAGITPDVAKQRAADLLHAGVPATILEVGGDPMLTLARDALGNASPAVTGALEQLAARQEGQSARLVGGFLNAALNGRKLGIQNIWNAADELHAAGLKNSAPFYEDAFERTVQVSDRMHKLLQHPAMRRAWQIGAKLAQDETLAGIGHGLPVPRTLSRTITTATGGVFPPGATTRTVPLSEIPVRGIDYLKRGLDALIKNRSVVGKMSIGDRQAQAWTRMKDELVSEAIDQVPAYGKALEMYSGPMGSRDALEAGTDILKKNWQQVHKEVLALSPSDRDFYRAGAARALYDEMLKSRHSTADLAAKFFGGSVVGRPTAEALRIRAMFLNNDAAANAFKRMVAGEAAISHSGGRALRLPSATSVEKIKQATEGHVLPVRGTLGLTLATAGRAAIERTRTRMSQEVNDALAELFVRGLQDPTHLFVLLDDLAHATSRGGAFRKAATATSALAGSAIGAQTR